MTAGPTVRPTTWRPTRRGRSAAASLLVTVAAVVLAGCASIPTSGPVEAGDREESSPSAAPFDFNPPGPRAGATPEQVASGFLSALQATPVSTKVAAEFLTASAAETWQPGRRTIVYSSQRLVTGVDGVLVTLTGAHELDRYGRWLGAPSGDGEVVLRLRMVREKGEWRLVNPPDAMVIPQAHFESRYRAYSLYFFDRTGSVLVPEPVYLPWGVQAPTLLVSGLLAGPSGAGRSTEQTFFPRGTIVGVGVPVGDDGVAEVPLSAQMRGLPEGELDLAMAQLAWTLRQVPDVERMEVTIDGVAIDLPGGRTTADVGGWSAYSPTVSAASADLFGMRGHEIRQIVGDTEIAAATLPAEGPGAVGPVRSLAVSMTGQRFAVVDDPGARVLVASRSDEEPAVPGIVYLGNDVLRPMWDLTDRLWVVDRTTAGPVVTVVRRGRARVLDAPGLRGRDVMAAALSRDGTRLALVAGTGRATRLLLLRVVRDAKGAPTRLTRAVPVPTGESWAGVRAIGWRDPTTVAALTRPSPGTSEVLMASVDGASAFEPLRSSVDLLFDAGVGLAASPGGPTALLVATRTGRLHALDSQGRWDFDMVEPGLRKPTFVG